MKRGLIDTDMVAKTPPKISHSSMENAYDAAEKNPMKYTNALNRVSEETNKTSTGKDKRTKERKRREFVYR